jgi:hypothetical protein
MQFLMKLKEKPRPEVISSMIIQNMMPAHFFINGLEETIGPDDLEKLLKSIPNSTQYKNEILPDPLQPVRQKMNELYGPTGARGIAMCSGKAGFKYILKQQSKQLGFESDAFRFLPGKYKLKRGLSLLADWMMEIYHEEMQISTGYLILRVATNVQAFKAAQRCVILPPDYYRNSCPGRGVENITELRSSPAGGRVMSCAVFRSTKIRSINKSDKFFRPALHGF